ncbi:hypothetical protein J2P12_02380, partial [Candidatus Bathyarchaeota archaeon]|nr:hypothetical protein [Candidatus Bathyarchaeota archaeon]
FSNLFRKVLHSLCRRSAFKMAEKGESDQLGRLWAFAAWIKDSTELTPLAGTLVTQSAVQGMLVSFGGKGFDLQETSRRL